MIVMSARIGLFALAVAVAAPPAPAAELKLDAAAIERFGLRFALPQPTGGARSARLPGEITVPPEAIAVVSAAVPALVVRTRRAAGESVERGEPLVGLKSIELIETQSEYLRERAALALARTEFERDGELAAAGAIPQRRLDTSRTAYRLAQLHVNEMRARLLASGMSEAAVAALAGGGRLMDVVELTAPISGVVLEATGAAGARVEAMTPLYRIAATDRLWVESHAPQETAAGIAPGQVLLVGDGAARAVIISVARAVASGSNTVLVRAELQQPGSGLRPGQFVMTEWRGGGDALAVPASAVVRRGEDDYVFVRTSAGVAAMPVTVSAREAGGVRLSGGIGATDSVVIEGAAQLKALWQSAEESP